jgi:uncharacterized Tic20 family protein
MDQNMDSPNPNSEDQPQQSEPQAPPATEQIPSEPTQKAPESVAVSQDSKNMGMLCHLLAIFTVFLCPLLIWLIKKDEDEFVDSQGKEALNFQITVMFAMIASWILMPVLIGFFLLFATVICDLVFCILASVAASKGIDYRYLVSLRLIK